MIISPFGILFALYFVANIISMAYGINDGGMQLEGKFFELSDEALISSMLLQLFFASFLWFFYRAFLKSSTTALKLGGGCAWFLFIVQVIFLIYNQATGVNVAGVESHGSALGYIFIILQPDVLFLLVALGLKSRSWFLLNCLVFLASMFLRGWMGGIFVVAVLSLCRLYPVRVSLRSFGRGALCVLVVLALLPVVIDAKWAMRTGLSISEFISGLANIDLDSYSAALRYVMNRFQHVGHVALVLENSSSLLSAYINGEYIPYWADGLPQMVMYKAFGVEYLRLNSYMVNSLFGYPDAYWNTNPGLAGWAAILKERVIFLLLYLILLLSITYYFIARYAGKRYLLLLASFSLVYLYHGWVGAFFNLCFYAVIFVILLRSRFTVYSRSALGDNS